MDLCESMSALITNDGNSCEVLIRPVARADVAVALWCLPGMDGVRKQVAPRGGRQRAGRMRTVKPKGKRAALTWKLP